MRMHTLYFKPYTALRITRMLFRWVESVKFDRLKEFYPTRSLLAKKQDLRSWAVYGMNATLIQDILSNGRQWLDVIILNIYYC